MGLLVIPVKLYKATEENEYALNLVHKEDGGKIQFRRFCELDGKEVPFENIGRGKKVGDLMLQMTDAELEKLAMFTDKVVEVTQFISASEVDLTAFGDAYYIEPEGVSVRIYALLRQQIKASGKVGVGTFAMRTGSKDSLCIIRAHRKMLILQRVAWPEEVREPVFGFLDTDVVITDMERELATQLIDTMTAPWKPEEHQSRYGLAFRAIIKAKLEGTPPPEPPPAAQMSAMQDIGAVLTAAIEEQKKSKNKKGAAA